MLVRTILGLLAITFMAGCSASTDKGIAEGAVTQFHQRLNTGAYKEMYSVTDSKLRAVTNESDFVALMAAIHKKLGAHQTKAARGWHVNWTLEGTFVSLSYETRFAEGKATEDFVWRVRDGRAQLVSYNVNSPQLILK